MRGVRPWKTRRKGEVAPAPLRRSVVLGKAAILGLAMAAGGCSSVSTPLPDLGPSVSKSMSQRQQQEAVDELARKRDTHEEEAERQIEEQR